jgi:hypothetical protein
MAECGHLVVPENWENENSRRIYLPLLHVYGTSTKKTAPLVFLSGGCGVRIANFKTDTAAYTNLYLNSPPLKYHHV